jgi:hypothetical protein
MEFNQKHKDNVPQTTYVAAATITTNPHWARVVCYGLFSLWVIHKEDLSPGSRGIDRLMIMMMITISPVLHSLVI